MYRTAKIKKAESEYRKDSDSEDRPYPSGGVEFWIGFAGLLGLVNLGQRFWALWGVSGREFGGCYRSLKCRLNGASGGGFVGYKKIEPIYSHTGPMYGHIYRKGTSWASNEYRAHTSHMQPHTVHIQSTYKYTAPRGTMQSTYSAYRVHIDRNGLIWNAYSPHIFMRMTRGSLDPWVRFFNAGRDDNAFTLYSTHSCNIHLDGYYICT